MTITSLNSFAHFTLIIAREPSAHPATSSIRLGWALSLALSVRPCTGVRRLTLSAPARASGEPLQFSLKNLFVALFLLCLPLCTHQTISIQSFSFA